MLFAACSLSRRAVFALALPVVASWLGSASPALAVTNVFFTGSQPATLVNSNINAVTIRSLDYLFTYSVDGYWAPYAGGTPTGRFFSVFWPTGVQAQAITAGPLSGKGANITIKRVDGKRFDLRGFTGKLLANTAGPGGSFEITPQIGGEDAFNDPLMYDATGYGGQSFAYTPGLVGYDTYKVHLWVDWALTALTLVDTNPPIPFTPTFTIAAGALPSAAGVITGTGSYTSNATCTLTATATVGWTFTRWTEGAATVSTSPAYSFTATASRLLVADFVAQPVLGSSAAPGGAVTLTWPAGVTDWILQECGDVSSGTWTNSTRTVSNSGGQRHVTIPPGSANAFFRLALP